MTSIKIAAIVLFLAGVISAINGKWEPSLIFLSTAFGLFYCLEADIPWNQPLSRKRLWQDLAKARWNVTVLGKASQYLSLTFLILFFIVHFS